MTVSKAELRERAAAVDLDGASAVDIVQWAVAATEGQLTVASSMQDSLVPHLVSQELPGVDVIFLDTGYHFPETLATRSAFRRMLPITVRTITPRQSVAEQDAEFGERLYERDPSLCCFLRKVDPLAGALVDYLGWVSGVRRAESASRAQTRAIAWDEKQDLLKVNPLINWTDDDVFAYQEKHQLPRNPLIYQGYPSIGCAPCTQKVAPGADPRSGRWAGSDKVECGLHI